ncbi:unnamed protein product [Effrenium voratum]|nr:unnamed protein product [Effrenium voratum]CAJ1431447.1 unnamed protein product [Effrenium voratum]
MAFLEKATDFRKNATRTMSEKWQTFSVPSALRRAKMAVTGTSKMAHDPLEEQRAELGELEGLTTGLLACARTLSCAVEMLAAAPKPLFDPLSRFYGENAPGSPAIEKLCAQLNAFAQKSTESDAELEMLQSKLQAMSERSKVARQSFVALDEAFSSQDHYTKKLEKLREQIAKGGSSPALVQKLNRNEEKLRSSQQAFASRVTETGSQVNEVLEHRWQEVGQAVAQMSQYYVSLFQAAGALGHELQQVHHELTRPATSEAMLRMGQELAKKARDSLRTKCSSEGSGISAFQSNRSNSRDLTRASTADLGVFDGTSGGAGYSQWPSQAAPWPTTSGTWPGAAQAGEARAPRSPWDTGGSGQVRRNETTSLRASPWS